MSIVATGLTGSIGRHLPRTAIELKSRLEWSAAVMVEELRALPDPARVLINVAAVSSVEACATNPELATELNVHGAVRWMRAAAQMGCKHFIQLSTSHVFKPTESHEWLTPSREKDPVTIYGKTKALAEEQLARWARELGMELTIARVFNAIGSGLRPECMYADLERRARERDFKPLPGHQNVRDFLDVGTICSRLMMLASSEKSSGIVHICSGDPMSIRELATIVMKVNGIDPSEIGTMFPEPGAEPNYLISRPSEISVELDVNQLELTAQ